MIISSSVEAGTLIGSLREMRGLSRRELSAASGVPLRTVMRPKTASCAT